MEAQETKYCELKSNQEYNILEGGYEYDHNRPYKGEKMEQNKTILVLNTHWSIKSMEVYPWDQMASSPPKTFIRKYPTPITYIGN